MTHAEPGARRGGSGGEGESGKVEAGEAASGDVASGEVKSGEVKSGEVKSGEAASDEAAQVLDTRGLRCPAPVIELARAARADGSARVLTVWWTDPAAQTDIGAWARMRGHEVLGTEPLAESDETAATAASSDSPSSDSPSSASPSSEGPAYATRVRLTRQ